MVGISPRSMKAVQTSWYSGSPSAPGSLVRSSTVIRSAVAGMTASRCSAEKGRIQAHLDQADLFAAGVQVIDDLFDGFAGRPHGDDHPLGIGVAHIVEQLVVPAGELADLFHVVLDDVRHLEVISVGRLAALKVDVRILGRAPQFGRSGLTARARKLATASMLTRWAMSS